jgi:ubiquinone/menaquinone biosynthesis C-methylase UbiE
MKMSDFAYEMMAGVGLPIRNIFMPPGQILNEVEINPGDKILDYGCGPGFFAIMLAKRTGGSGTVYALDIHPVAIELVERRARKQNLSNIKTILSDCSTSLMDGSIDRVIFFDVFHDLDNPKEVLFELHRVMKPEAAMYFSDHHMKEKQILDRLTKDRLFVLRMKGRRTFTFGKGG